MIRALGLLLLFAATSAGSVLAGRWTAPRIEPETVAVREAKLVARLAALEAELSELRRRSLASPFAPKPFTKSGLSIRVGEVAGSPVPAIDGKVSRVKDDVSPALVLLSVGSNDKVEKGYHLAIYRGDEFIGKVVVEKVLPDSCGCRVLFTKEDRHVQVGDAARTRSP